MTTRLDYEISNLISLDLLLQFTIPMFMSQHADLQQLECGLESAIQDEYGILESTNARCRPASPVTNKICQYVVRGP